MRVVYPDCLWVAQLEGMSDPDLVPHRIGLALCRVLHCAAAAVSGDTFQDPRSPPASDGVAREASYREAYEQKTTASRLQVDPPPEAKGGLCKRS
jgi:hypothetical protein